MADTGTRTSSQPNQPPPGVVLPETREESLSVFRRRWRKFRSLKRGWYAFLILCTLYGIGIEIQQLVLQDVNPPGPVRPAFNEVNQAIQEKERAINEAWADYNQTVPNARGEAERVTDLPVAVDDPKWFPDGKGLPVIDIQCRNDEIMPRLAEALQAMWQRELGVRSTIEPFEQKIWLQNQQTKAHTIGLMGWVADFADPLTFLGLFVTGGGNNRTGWSNKRYDELIELAHQRKLPGDATGGSIATVTNFGTFGLTWATPIPLPEQTLVLGLGAGRRMPHWDEAKGQVAGDAEANQMLARAYRTPWIHPTPDKI